MVGCALARVLLQRQAVGGDRFLEVDGAGFTLSE